MLLWTHVYKFLCRHDLLGIYLGVNLLGDMVSLSLVTFFEEYQTLANRLPHFTFPSAVCEDSGFFFSHPHPHLIWLSLILITLVVVKWYLISVDLHFPDSNHVEHLFMCLLTACIFTLEKYLFNSLPIFKLGYLF